MIPKKSFLLPTQGKKREVCAGLSRMGGVHYSLGHSDLRCFCCVFKTASDEQYIHVSGFDIFTNNIKQHENGRSCWGGLAFRGRNMQQKLLELEWVSSFTKQLEPWELAAGAGLHLSSRPLCLLCSNTAFSRHLRSVLLRSSQLC